MAVASFHGRSHFVRRRQGEGDRRALSRGEGSHRRLLDHPGPLGEEAIEWAERAPMSDNEVIEVRQIHEMPDLPKDVQKAAEGFEHRNA